MDPDPVATAGSNADPSVESPPWLKQIRTQLADHEIENASYRAFIEDCRLATIPSFLVFQLCMFFCSYFTSSAKSVSLTRDSLFVEIHEGFILVSRTFDCALAPRLQP
jgi:hypothetical protein